ncbi:helix-turn-helix domain-containing protein [Candidatus Omnitrophota bacterium]
MKNEKFLTIKELADILGISRIAVYKKVKKGQIKAMKIGRNFAIPKRYISNILGKVLKEKEKQNIDKAVKRTVREYGEVLKMLGKT